MWGFGSSSQPLRILKCQGFIFFPTRFVYSSIDTKTAPRASVNQTETPLISSSDRYLRAAPLLLVSYKTSVLFPQRLAPSRCVLGTDCTAPELPPTPPSFPEVQPQWVFLSGEAWTTCIHLNPHHHRRLHPPPTFIFTDSHHLEGQKVPGPWSRRPSVCFQFGVHFTLFSLETFWFSDKTLIWGWNLVQIAAGWCEHLLPPASAVKVWQSLFPWKPMEEHLCAWRVLKLEVFYHLAVIWKSVQQKSGWTQKSQHAASAPALLWLKWFGDVCFSLLWLSPKNPPTKIKSELQKFSAVEAEITACRRRKVSSQVKIIPTNLILERDVLAPPPLVWTKEPHQEMKELQLVCFLANGWDELGSMVWSMLRPSCLKAGVISDTQ